MGSLLLDDLEHDLQDRMGVPSLLDNLLPFGRNWLSPLLGGQPGRVGEVSGMAEEMRSRPEAKA